MRSHLVLKVVAKFLIPLIAVYGFYVHFHGDFGPGGGFQAGVIVASAVILYALVFGTQEAKKAVPPSWARIGMCLGVLFYAGTGVINWALGGSYLDYNTLAYDPHHLTSGQHLGIIMVELGVLTTVASVMLAIFYAFSSRQPDITDEDW